MQIAGKPLWPQPRSGASYGGLGRVLAAAPATNLRFASGKSNCKWKVSNCSHVHSVLAIQNGLISIAFGGALPSGEKTNFPAGMGIISNTTVVSFTRSV